MSKKHFIALADHIRDNRARYSDETIQSLARFCAEQNPRFNEPRWLGYIAGTNGKNGGAVKRS